MTGPADASLLESISAALALIRREGTPLPQAALLPAPALPSLLDQCRALHAEARDSAAEPLRTLHHMACTGGTLISKCLAVMPNVRLLSEIAPLSPIGVEPGKPRFLPSDLILQLKSSHRPPGDADLTEIFLAALEVLLRQTRLRGERLVLRDHAHSQFCHGPDIPGYPPLHRMVAGLAPVRSAVTLRHPLDSYLSLRNNKWEHHQPPGLAEYARRYMAFLDAHAGIPSFRYEDFTADPDRVLAEICAALELPFSAHATQSFGIIHISGDSGRSSAVIAPRPRRDVPPALADVAASSDSYRALCDRMGYDAGPPASRPVAVPAAAASAEPEPVPEPAAETVAETVAESGAAAPPAAAVPAQGPVQRPVRVFICGSCVSRDAFEHPTAKGFKLVDYFARSSFASSFAEPPAADLYSERVASAFQRRQISRDFRKALPGALQGSSFDLLLVDFIDDRFPLFAFADGPVVTISAELHMLRVLNDSLGTRFDPFDERQFALWCAGWERLVAQLRAEDRLERLVINRVYWTQTTLEGLPHPAALSEDIPAANAYLDRMYARCAADLAPEQFLTYPPDLMRSDPNHRWGPAPYHYGQDFYAATMAWLAQRAAALAPAALAPAALAPQPEAAADAD